MASRENGANECGPSKGPSWIPPALNTKPKWPDDMIKDLAYLYFCSNMTAHQLQLVMTASFNVDCKGISPNGELIRGKVRLAATGKGKANAVLFEEVAEIIRVKDTAKMDELRQKSTIGCLEFCVNILENREAVPQAWKDHFLKVSWENVTVGRNEKRLEEFMENRVHWG